MNKITFENKLNSINIDGEFIISSTDINQMKNAINSNISQLQQQKFLKNKIFKYFSFTVPENINANYDIIFEVSETNDFENSKIVKLSQNKQKFYIFENFQFIAFENNYISNEQKQKVIIIDLDSILENYNFSFCRLRFKNVDSASFTEYFSTGINPISKISVKKSDKQFFTVAKQIYANSIKTLLDVGFQLDTILKSINYVFDQKTQITLKSYIYQNKVLTDVTGLTSYSLSNQSISLNSNVIQAFNASEIKIFNVSSIYENNQFSLNIVVNPVSLIDLQTNITSINGTYVLKCYAKYSNQTYLDVTDNQNLTITFQKNNFKFQNKKFIPLGQNVVDYITFTYEDIDFSTEQISKTIILKSYEKKLSRIVSTLTSESLSFISNSLNYSVKAIFTDESEQDITFNQNLKITIPLNKTRSSNILTLDKQNAKISADNIIYQQTQPVIFEYTYNGNTCSYISYLNLLDSNLFSLSGNLVISTSSQTSFQLIPIQSQQILFNQIQRNQTSQDLSNQKKIDNTQVQFTAFSNLLNVDLSNNKNCWSDVDIFTKTSSDVEFKYKSLKLPNSFNFFENEYYRLVFSTISKNEKAKFIKDYQISDINKAFGQNYVLGFKDINLNLVQKISNTKIYLQLIGLIGIFETSSGFQFQQKFIYDQEHDLWIVNDVPLKATKLKSLKISLAYLIDKVCINKNVYPLKIVEKDIPTWNKKYVFVCSRNNTQDNVISSTKKLQNYIVNGNSNCIYHVNIFSKGIANSTTVNSSGHMYIRSGGTANLTTINSDGFSWVYSGGIANLTTVNYYGRLSVYSGTANSTTVNSYGFLYVAPGVANSITVNSCGYLIVSSGGTANSTTLNSGGYLQVYPGGTAISTTINLDGSLYVFSGGTALNVIQNSNGRIGGVIPGAYIDGSGIYGSFHAENNLASNFTMNSSGYLYVYSGGIANLTTVNSAGRLLVFQSGGTANSTTVNSYGWLYVNSGGTVNSTTVNELGSLYVYSDGTANSTIVNLGGFLIVSSGGTALNVTSNKGALISSATGATITYI